MDLMILHVIVCWQCVAVCCSVLQCVAVSLANLKSHVSHDSSENESQLKIKWHRILRLFLKTFNSVPGVPGFSMELQ